MFDHSGWNSAAVKHPSSHCDSRPAGVNVSLLVIHNISLPPGKFGGPFIDQLFTGNLNCDDHPYFRKLEGLRVSSHFLIHRDGGLVQYVPTTMRAWHAGKSCYQGRSACNDFSIGIELEGTDTHPYSTDQYRTLLTLTANIMHTYPKITLGRIVGHCDIAPGRKTDPGEAFDWPGFRRQLREIL
ncbi:1,6-anhydro-N-acetylmuramyl-L-alanine amidase AmpD [Lacimicrobium alkaliphilum]|uniref:1,6-anhydro-N-acetylmuramyl-L-alanine amidase AmpD n=1 Tax=Lacimicrobium alkaliphilum TaxID=1526571 RepID=A0ABQ1RBF2_9ALTE|nr:1,6-anhydro-N-acetylmuramyl-L-alanine amidase AmpD [Lacimicrobium alkaliphilum]GGD64817.1 N-acetyl-anhydromuranmyl-L-alanine amidase [Lacimicrobium alkaliphilum]